MAPWGWGLVLVLGLLSAHPRRAASMLPEGFSVVGSQGLGDARVPYYTRPGLRVSVLETDAWSHSLSDGSLRPYAQIPLKRSWWVRLRVALDRKYSQVDLLAGAHFTPAAYLEQIQTLQKTYCRQRDVLMYYGGIARPDGRGLNFNAWSREELETLRRFEGRPFIGLETMDRKAILSLVRRLKAAGYSPYERIYVRIGAEPSGSSYGTEDGTPAGKHHTFKAFAAYRRRFALTSRYLNTLNRQYGLDMHTVFAGTNDADFERYVPSPDLFDAIGYDLYVTPENKEIVLRRLRKISHRYPYKPLVIPEFGIATRGPIVSFWGRHGSASPQWAGDTLGDVLEVLGKHPAGVQQMTLFSVNAAGRLSHRRWNWAWTPAMFEMVKEWTLSPRKWRKKGFHRYDPPSYPVGRDVLLVNHSGMRVVYRKLSTERAPGIPLFEENYFLIQDGLWTHRTRTVFWNGSEIREHSPQGNIL